MEAITSLFVEAFSDRQLQRVGINPECLSRLLNESALLTVFDDGCPVAVVAYHRVCLEVVEILFLGIAEKFRGAGRMRHTLALALFEWSSGGVQEIWAEMHEENFEALAFYRRCSFKEVGRRERYYADGHAAILLKMSCEDFSMNF